MKKRTLGKVKAFLLVVFIAMLAIGCAETASDKKDDGGGDGSVYNDKYNLSLRSAGPAGGLIFYINPNANTDGWKYLEAAPSDLVDSVWIAGGSTQTTINGNTSNAIGKGKANTTAIIGQTGHTDSAAKLCDDLTLGGQSDWFLPSKDELNKMYVNLKKGTDENGVVYIPVGGFADSVYWSSSEIAAAFVWVQAFFNGFQTDFNKSIPDCVRAVRAF